MTGLDHRQLGRESLFLMADLRVGERQDDHRVKVRNLSAGGMMAEGSVKVMRGSQVHVNLRNVGWVDGVVAWIQDNRFGIAFVEDIDPKAAQSQVSSA
ncbi:PilZ domain-containing protein [Novosphingobium sp. ZN18A2]|uniref:PilZ domain-containing protein n=1 Tax=Novosphingobium sp. ZN18A2 TaxID=3079861 RepID=UPI0030D15AAD